MTLIDDSHALPLSELTALLHDAPWRRVAVLGDSVAEGVGEPRAGYRNLTWVDRVVEALRAGAWLTVTNLGRRDLRASEVRERQLAAALDFEPDLAIVAAGGNDALRRSFDPSAVADELDAIVAPLRRAGAEVLVVDLLDIASAGLVPADRAAAIDARFAALSDVTRAVALRHGAVFAGLRGHPAAADPDIYASDRVHLNARGHAIVGTEAARALTCALGRRAAA